ncbi:MAG: hypothetical protein E6J29_01465 [Chloroflexi bacterium]|nr:MAG: hypothetical protein E6J29_01465 [Chloroflexota bacterium]TMD52431.1 MAG: hypothetical protein E6I85_10610 [Chloroflexota bacterium]
MSGLEVLDPTGERQPRERRRLPRPDSIDGRRVALLDISKARGNVFLDRLEQLLSERGAKTERFRKPTFARPAPRALLEEITARSDLVVEALAD